jgi:hypothetical protein
MVGAFVAATVVSLVQFVRLRDKRLLLLAAMFACQSQALAREWYDVWRDVFQSAVCAAGLLLVLALAPRAVRVAQRPPAAPDASGPQPASGLTTRTPA